MSGEVTDLGAGDGNVGKALGAKYFYDYIASFEGCEEIDLMKSLPILKGDTFVLSHVLEHLPDPKFALQNLQNAMKDGDRLIICVPNAANAENTAIPFHQYIPSNDMSYKHKHHVYAWTLADMFNTLVSFGFENVDIASANVCGFDCIWAYGEVKK